MLRFVLILQLSDSNKKNIHTLTHTHTRTRLCTHQRKRTSRNDAGGSSFSYHFAYLRSTTLPTGQGSGLVGKIARNVRERDNQAPSSAIRATEANSHRSHLHHDTSCWSCGGAAEGESVKWPENCLLRKVRRCGNCVQ